MMPGRRNRSCSRDATKPTMWPNVGPPELVTPPSGDKSGGRSGGGE
jgi:hypothetical protein